VTVAASFAPFEEEATETQFRVPADVCSVQLTPEFVDVEIPPP
jgi:hypothetical protein